MKNSMGIRIRLSLTEIFYNGCFASSCFMSVFLQALGIGPGQIGIITSLTNVMNIVAQPAWGVMADRIQSVRKCFMMSILFAGICVVFVPGLSVAGAIMPMLVLLVLQYLFLMPANMLMELWLVKVNNTPSLGISYGSIRMWASLGFALMNLAYVPILKRLPVRSIYYFYAAFALMAALIAWRMPAGTEPDARSEKQPRLRDMPFKKIMSYWIVTYLIFEVAFQIPFGWCNSYMVYAVNDFGVESSRLGAFMFISGMCEIPMLLFSKKLIRRMGLALPLFISVLLTGVEYALYTFGSSMAALWMSRVCQGFGYALYVACRYQYIARLAPDGLGASTQAVINAAYAGVNIIAAVFGGFILESLGTRSFFMLLTVIQASAALIFVGSQWFGVKVLGKKLPGDLLIWGRTA